MSVKADMGAIPKIVRLYRMYVSGTSEVDVHQLRDVIRQQSREAESGAYSVSPEKISELRSDRAFVGAYIDQGGT